MNYLDSDIINICKKNIDIKKYLLEKKGIDLEKMNKSTTTKKIRVRDELAKAVVNYYPNLYEID